MPTVVFSLTWEDRPGEMQAEAPVCAAGIGISQCQIAHLYRLRALEPVWRAGCLN